MINLRRIREQLNFSQDEMGEILKLTRESISRIETGKSSFSPRAQALLENYLERQGHRVNDRGELSMQNREQELQNRLSATQERLINQQRIQIESLQRLIAEKVVLLEAYVKVIIQHLVRVEAELHNEDLQDLSTSAAKELHEEMRDIRKDIERHYVVGS